MDETKQDIDRMASLSGAEFDREFMNMVVTDHQRTLELFRSVSLTAHDTDVQDLRRWNDSQTRQALEKSPGAAKQAVQRPGKPDIISGATPCGAGPGVGCGLVGGIRIRLRRRRWNQFQGSGLVQAVVDLVSVCCRSRKSVVQLADLSLTEQPLI